MKVKSDHRSKFSNLSNWKEEAWKKIRASTGFELVTSAIPVRCSTNWAMKPHIGSEVNLLSSYLPVQWNDVKFIWNNSHLYCENQGFNGIRTHDLRDAGAMLNQLSYEATHWERGQFIDLISSRAVKWCDFRFQIQIFYYYALFINYNIINIYRSLHEIIHICTTVVDESEEWSSQ